MSLNKQVTGSVATSINNTGIILFISQNVYILIDEDFSILMTEPNTDCLKKFANSQGITLVISPQKSNEWP